MSDLISRSELLQEFETETNRHSGNDLWHYTGIKAFIENAPSVEAKPVVHGEWLSFDEEANGWYCSKCGNIWQLNDGTPEENHMNFCPNCGADMRKKA